MSMEEQEHPTILLQDDGDEDAAPPPCLPSEITEQILARLPATSLLRFKSVSKSWNNCISHPYFMKLHQDLFPSREPPILVPFGIVRKPVIKFYSVDLKQEDLQIINKESPISFLSQSACFVLCSCKGVILLEIECNNPKEPSMSYVLYNPYSRVHTELPPMPRYYKKYPNWIYGLCYDSIKDDFKVVLFERLSFSSTNLPCFIFSCKEGTWTQKGEFPRDLRPKHQDGIYVGGSCYWICYNRFDRGWPNCIGYFDSKDDLCDTFDLPQDSRAYHVEGSQFSMWLTCFRGSLCLCLSNKRELHLWTLVENSGNRRFLWKKFPTIQLSFPFQYSIEFYPVSDDVVVVFQHQNHVSVYDAVFSEKKLTLVWNLRKTQTKTISVFFSILSRGLILTASLSFPTIRAVEESWEWAEESWEWGADGFDKTFLSRLWR